MEKFFKVREKSGKWKVLDAKSGKIGIMLAERFHVTVISSHAQGQKDGCSVGLKLLSYMYQTFCIHVYLVGKSRKIQEKNQGI